MDFKKLEGIFVLAFLGLNIFLLSIFFQSQKETGHLKDGEERDSIELRLAKDKISFSEKLSGEKPQGYFLSGEEDLYVPEEEVEADPVSPTQKLTYIIGESIPSLKTLEPDLKKFLRTYPKDDFPHDFYYLPEVSTINKTESVLIASQKYEGIPFYDDTPKMQITLKPATNSGYAIEKVTYTHLKDLKNLREKQDLISQREAISTLYYNSKIPPESKINWTLLAYGRILKVRETNVYVPVWFVSISSPDEKAHIEQVNGINNTIITATSIPTVEK